MNMDREDYLVREIERIQLRLAAVERQLADLQELGKVASMQNKKPHELNFCPGG